MELLSEGAFLNNEGALIELYQQLISAGSNLEASKLRRDYLLHKAFFYSGNLFTEEYNLLFTEEMKEMAEACELTPFSHRNAGEQERKRYEVLVKSKFTRITALLLLKRGQEQSLDVEYRNLVQVINSEGSLFRAIHINKMFYIQLANILAKRPNSPVHISVYTHLSNHNSLLKDLLEAHLDERDSYESERNVEAEYEKYKDSDSIYSPNFNYLREALVALFVYNWYRGKILEAEFFLMRALKTMNSDFYLYYALKFLEKELFVEKANQ